MTRKTKLFLQDIVKAIEEIEDFTKYVERI